ncbi:SIR2 family NAD-dependent protein deacylase [Propionibacterium sp. oral taxon 192]|uniref:SIR2 family NAD-dependent protein deacylase n=1 Tax=Propionibacterium sp. oral taxon 192 TaxID=671222 RepID=UPI001E5F6565|nr:NAD-dependent deacylase [Propionibacterium sp. oral taxon 192]
MSGPVVPQHARELAQAARRVLVLSGAGMSAESGVPTFRDAQTGLWHRYDPAELATPQAWARDPGLVWAWYEWRRSLVAACQPNAGHRALAEWARIAEMSVVTQNVDDLHERAGSAVVVHLHGSLFAHRCDSCGAPVELPVPDQAEISGRLAPPVCVHCTGRIRPGVVWFGEALPAGALDEAMTQIEASDLVMVVGTSGMVHPAAALPGLAVSAGVPVVEINPNPTGLPADVHWPVTAAVGLPALVDQLG